MAIRINKLPKRLCASSACFLISVSLLGLESCSSVEVHTAQAPNVNLSRYKSFAWSPVANSEEKPHASILDQELKASVDRELAQKGLKLETTDAPADLVVSYSAKSKTSYTYGIDDDWDYGFWGIDGPDVYPMHEGTLTLLLVDPKTNKVVWKGKASNVIDDAGESQKQVDEAVKDLFKKYPKL